MTYTTYKTNTTNSLLLPHGGYKKLLSYQAVEIAFDFGVAFLERYYRTYKTNSSNKTYGSYRSYDQLFQALRSGKQNIAEGSLAAGTSREMEFKFLNVARASQEEAIADCEDFLRQQGLALWAKDSAKAREIRALAYRTNRSYKTYLSYLAAPEGAANCLICLLKQAGFLLDRQIKGVEKQFLEGGGFKENLFRERQKLRSSRK